MEWWKDAEHDGQKVLNAAALKEVDNIQVHMKKECLSPWPGRETNRNENLHKDLSNIMSSSKYAVELAYALLTVIFFQRKAAKAEQRSEHPVEFYLHQHLSPATHEHFGLRFNEKDSPASAISAHSCPDTFTTLNLTSSTAYVQLYQRVMHTPLPHSGHGRQRFEFVDDETSQVEECELDSSPDNDDQNEHQPVSVAALKKILMQALAWFSLHKLMTNMSETAYIRLDQIPFIFISRSIQSHHVYAK